MLTKLTPPMAKILNKKFIEIYGHYAGLGYSREIVIHKTMYRVQEIVIQYMIEQPHEINIISAAYENLKHDTTLHEKAIIAFDLSKCDEKVRAKYSPLVMV